MIKQITNYEFDSRFYYDQEDYYPSVTYILSSTFPSGKGLTNWLGDVGNKRADEIKVEAGEEGTFVHDAILKMVSGKEISSADISQKFRPERSIKIKRCLQAFLDWNDEAKPEFTKCEYSTISKEFRYAGTIDLKCKIDGKTFIVDYKTSRSIQDSARLQIAAYGKSDNNLKDGIAILHLGNTTKKKFSFLDYTDKKTELFDKFRLTNRLFQELNPNARPSEEVFPDKFKIINNK